MPSHWTENSLLINGIRIHYTRTGDGSKPPLVLAHGFSDNGMTWLPVARDLEAEYDVLLPDARCHGLSARVQPGDVIDMPADLAGLVGALGLEQPILGGHSMGGSLTSAAVVRFPGLARALILEDPGWHDPRPSGESSGMNPFRMFLQTAATQSLEEIMAKGRADSPTWPEVEMRPWAESKQQLDLDIFTAEHAPEMGWRDVARGISCPTLLLTADTSKGAIVTTEMAAEAAALNPLIQVVNVPGAGHCIRRENYPAFMAAVTHFLKSLA